MSAVLAVALTVIAVTATAQELASSTLIAAIRANDLSAVKRIVSAGANPRGKDATGVSAPQVAVRLGHHVIAHYLLSYRPPKTASASPDDIEPAISGTTADGNPEPNSGISSINVTDIGPIETDPTVDLDIAGARPALPLPPKRSDVTSPSDKGPAEVAFTDLLETPATTAPLPTLVEPVSDPAPISDPAKRTAPLPGHPSATDTDIPVLLAEPSVPETSPGDAERTTPGALENKGLLARAADWVNGLFASKESDPPAATPAKTTQQLISADIPETKTAAVEDVVSQLPTQPPSAPETESDILATLPASSSDVPATTPVTDDLEKIAAASNPDLQSATPQLPEADLPKVLADAPVSDDPLAETLAQPDSGIGTLDGLGEDPLADLSAASKATEPVKSPPTAAKTPVNADLTTMSPKDRLAWLDALLARPLVRNADRSLGQSRDEALEHLRAQAEAKDAAEKKEREQQRLASAKIPERGEMPKDPSSPDLTATDLSSVEGPKPGTRTSRRLKIPLPPPDPNGRRAPSRDPWFRDVSPDEPDIRAAHKARAQRSRNAPAPERGATPDPIPAVPQLTGPKPAEPSSEEGQQKLAQNVPEPPPIRETPRPTAAAATTTPAPENAKASDGLDETLSELEKEFADPAKPGGDPLAAELGDIPTDKPAQAAKADADDPLADLLDDGPADKTKTADADDPLADLLSDGPADKEDAIAKTDDSDPLSNALDDLAGALDEPAADTVAAEAAAPPATRAEILSVLPEGSQVKLHHDGRPALPTIWATPVVLPGQQPPLADLASAYIIPAAFRAGFDNAASNKLLGDLPPGANAASAWPVTKIEMADGKSVAPPQTATQPIGGSTEDAPAQVSAATALDRQGSTLENVTLSLGTGVSLYNTFVPKDAKGGDGRAPECVEKAGGRTQVCIKELTWPAFLEPRFLVSTILYTGTGSIVRFDDGVPTRMHVVFNAPGFDEITDWMVRRFGPPTETVNRSVAPFGQARRDNPSMIWRSLDKVTQKTVSLEIRKYDDTRDGFPDIRNGVIMLFREGAPEIFPQVSIHELMRLKRTG